MVEFPEWESQDQTESSMISDPDPRDHPDHPESLERAVRLVAQD